jgi:hypothetical protein
MTKERQREEKTTPAWIAQIVRETGGIIGLRTGHEEVNTYDPPPSPTPATAPPLASPRPTTSAASASRSPLALGSDLNGFIQQVRPRFGPDACSASFPTEAQCQARDDTRGRPPPLGSSASTTPASATSACSPPSSTTSTSSAATPPPAQLRR